MLHNIDHLSIFWEINKSLKIVLSNSCYIEVAVKYNFKCLSGINGKCSLVRSN